MICSYFSFFRTKKKVKQFPDFYLSLFVLKTSTQNKYRVPLIQDNVANTREKNKNKIREK